MMTRIETAPPSFLRPTIPPPLDPEFRPLILPFRNFLRVAGECGSAAVRIGLERESGLVSVFEMGVPEPACCGKDCVSLIERIVKFLLWSRGGWKIHFQGPGEILAELQKEYRQGGARSFDVSLMEGVYERPFTVIPAGPGEFPDARERLSRLGGHLDGCRIGFDLGASDYKIAAVCDGQTLFSEEIPWIPGEQSDPDYHYHRIQEGLRRAATHLPRVDAIGGSSAGIFIDNEVRISSLFRSVPEDLFEKKVRRLFLAIRDEWGVPLEVINDGEVTALAAMLSLKETAVLGIAMGSSQAAGFLNSEGRIPGWLDELAFTPVDANPQAPRDEWSKDSGVGANYFSQQSVNRLALAAGFEFPDEMRLPERLERIQDLVAKGDDRAGKIFESIGIYLGYSIPWYEVFYKFRNLLVLGRVISGPGGAVILDKAEEVLRQEFPDSASRIRLHLLDEKSRRVGQAVAAASLPDLDTSIPMERQAG